MSKDFNGKVVIVTGASSPKGIGSQTARRFAEEGAKAVVITSRQQSAASAESVVNDLKKLGCEIYYTKLESRSFSARARSAPSASPEDSAATRKMRPLTLRPLPPA